MNNVSLDGFRPGVAATVNLSVTASTGNVQVQTGNRYRHVRIWNPSATVIVFVEFGDTNAVTASTTTSMPVAPGQTIIVSCPYQWIAAIGSAAGPTVTYFTPGEGGLS